MFRRSNTVQVESPNADGGGLRGALLAVAVLLMLSGCDSGVPQPQVETRSDPSPSPSPSPSPERKSDRPHEWYVHDVFFIDRDNGWALAGSHSGQKVTRIYGTKDGGETWAVLSEPNVPVANGSDDPKKGVRGIEFMNRRVGWIFRPSAYVTQDGGRTWRRAGRLQDRVLDIESGASSAWVLTASCYRCTLKIQRVQGQGVGWRPARHPRLGKGDGMLISGLASGQEGRAWVARWNPDTDGRATFADTSDGGRSWQETASPCPAGYATEVQVSLGFDRTLWALCGAEAGAGSQRKVYSRSFDGGSTWERPRSGFYSGYHSALQGVSEQVAWTAGSRFPLIVSRNGGVRWRLVMSRQDDGGWTDITFTDAKHGWAVFRNLVLRTVDGGTTWRQSLVAGARNPLAKNFGLCPEEHNVEADVNGDGLEDHISYNFIRKRAVLTVCTARGSRDHINTSGMSELLEIVDIQEDGQAEILYGGTTCCARLAYLATVRRGRIRTIKAEGEPLRVDSGPDFDPSVDTPLGRSWGCRDDDGDGAKDLVLVTVKPTLKRLRWGEQVFAIEEARAALLSENTGTTPRRGGLLEIQVVKAANELAPSACKLVTTPDIFSRTLRP